MEKINKNSIIEQYISDYSKLIFSICYKITKSYFDSQDLAQDTFMYAYMALGDFDGNNPKAWLVRIATNKSLDFMKSKKRQIIPTNQQELSLFEDVKTNIEKTYIDKEVYDRLVYLCNSLKPPYDEVARLYYCEEVPISEIAARRNTKLKTVQTQVYRAKKMLRDKWSNF